MATPRSAVPVDELPPEVRERLAARNPELAAALSTDAEPAPDPEPPAAPAPKPEPRPAVAPKSPKSPAAARPSARAGRAPAARAAGRSRARGAGKSGAAGVARRAVRETGVTGGSTTSLIFYFAGATLLTIGLVLFIGPRSQGVVSRVTTGVATGVRKLADPSDPLI